MQYDMPDQLLTTLTFALSKIIESSFHYDLIPTMTYAALTKMRIRRDDVRLFAESDSNYSATAAGGSAPRPPCFAEKYSREWSPEVMVCT